MRSLRKLSRRSDADYGVPVGVVSAVGSGDGVALLELAACSDDSDMVAVVWGNDIGDGATVGESGFLAK
jgi:hypothetical protein